LVIEIKKPAVSQFIKTYLGRY